MPMRYRALSAGVRIKTPLPSLQRAEANFGIGYDGPRNLGVSVDAARWDGGIKHELIKARIVTNYQV